MVLDEVDIIEVSTTAVAKLLKTAVRCRDRKAFQLLRKQFYKAVEIHRDDLYLLIRLAVQQRSSKVLAVLQELDPAAYLRKQQVTDVLKAVVRTGQHKSHQLYQLPEELMHKPDITPAVVLAVQLGRQKALQQLCSISHDIWDHSVTSSNLPLHALSAAVQCNNLPALQQLCSKLEHCVVVSGVELDAVLHLAVALNRQAAINILCSSQLVATIDSSNKSSIRSAEGHKCYCAAADSRHSSAGAAGRRVGWPVEACQAVLVCFGSAGWLGGGYKYWGLGPLLAAAAVAAEGSAAVVVAAAGSCQQSILSLPGMYDLDSDAVGRLLASAVQLQHVAMVQQLYALDAADQLDDSQAGCLLETAVDMHYSSWLPFHSRDNQGKILQCLCSLYIVANLSRDWVLDCMEAAVEHDGELAVKIISKLPGA